MREIEATPLEMWARCAPEEAVDGPPLTREKAQQIRDLHAELSVPPNETIELSMRKFRVPLPFDETGES